MGIKVSFLSNFFDKEPIMMSMGEVKDIIRKDKDVKLNTLEYRHQKQLLKDETLSGSAKAEAKRLAEMYKHKIGVVIPSAECEGGKSREHVKRLLPMVGVDIDHITHEQRNKALDLLEKDKHSSLVAESPSGDGARAFIPISGIEELQRIWDNSSKRARTEVFKYAWKQVAEYVEELTGLTVDENCAKPEQAYTIGYDPDVYYNPNAVPFAIDMSGYEAPKAGRPKVKAKATDCKEVHHVKLSQVQDVVTKALSSGGITIDKGRNNYLYHFASLCNKYGVDDEEVAAWAMENLEEDDFNEKEILTTVASAYRYTEDHGTKSLELNPIEFITKSLHEQADFRYNVILGRLELKYHPEEEDDGDWHVITDRDFSTLYTRVRNQRKVNANDVNAVLSSRDFCKEYHPMKAYLDACPQWEPSHSDYIRQYFDHLVLSNKALTERLYYYYRMWFLRFVALILGIIDKNQLMPALVGAENTGKTYFWEVLLPPVLRGYYQRIDPNDNLDKDMLIMLSNKMLCNFDERRISKRNSDTFKSVISGGLKSVRKPYGRYAEDIRQSASMTMTSNDQRYIGNSDGNRRYLSIGVAGTLNFNEHPVDYERMYAQAYYLITHGELHNFLTKQEAQELKEMNKEYTEIDACTDAVTTFFRIPQPGDTGIERMTITLIKTHIGNHYGFDEMSATRIGTTLHELGFKKHKSNGCYVYDVIRRDLTVFPVDDDEQDVFEEYSGEMEIF